MRLEVTFLDGATRTLQVTALERMAWERYARAQNLPLNPRLTAGAKGKPGAVDVERFPIDTWQTYMAYVADTKALHPRPDFEDWAGTVAQATASDPGDESDPTQAEPISAESVSLP